MLRPLEDPQPLEVLLSPLEERLAWLRATLRSFSEEGEFTNDADKVLSLGTGGKAYAAARSLAHSLRRTLSDAASPHPLAGTPTTARSISTRRRT